MKEFTIYVEGIGYADEMVIKAKDLTSAKKKAKKEVMKVYAKYLKAYKA